MKRSDPKQVIVLSVVAVGAVGYLMVSLLGAGRRAGSPSPTSSAQEESREPSHSAPLELLRDPFSHPTLIASARDVRTQTPPPEPAAEPATMPGAAPLPIGSGMTFGSVGPVSVRPEPSSDDPAESAGPDRKLEVAKGPRIALSAIVKVDRPMAFLSIEGSESRAFQVGALIAPGVRLVDIQAGLITLRFRGKSTNLKVGEEAAL